MSIVSDWRLMNQEAYLKNKRLYHINYNKKEEHDHDHCAFCMQKILFRKSKSLLYNRLLLLDM